MKRFIHVRTSRSLGARVVVFALVLVSPVAADAPTSGPDRQYEDFDSSSPEITDRFTHLVWQRLGTPYPDKMTFADAQKSCPADMRLPSMKELLTIVDEAPHEQYDTATGANVPAWFDGNAFPNAPPDKFWTSSASPNGMWTVDFGSGKTIVADPMDLRRVRCVRFAP